MPGHIGHWSTSLLYVAPVALLIVYLAVQSLRERRRGGPPGSGD
jgi:cytochrome c-type biogenesis protein CcmH/NrfF